MRKRKPKVVTQYKCDYCKDTTSSFITTATYKHFCRIQTPGQPADKDCMTDYLNNESIAKQFTIKSGAKKL